VHDRACVQARSHTGKPPPGGKSCVKTMRPRSSSVRSQRLFKASSACSRHASVQVGSWDRRSRVYWVSASCSSPCVCAREWWRALAGGSSKQVIRVTLDSRALPIAWHKWSGLVPDGVNGGFLWLPGSALPRLDRRDCSSRARGTKARAVPQDSILGNKAGEKAALFVLAT
jgi:hypothetical protein